ncbi:hypothetical protein [uncultured Pseudodesulfovibrio sp.]|nr:hypothetical protein [uncultured Pseudodesulfovibrio sp.]
MTEIPENMAQADADIIIDIPEFKAIRQRLYNRDTLATSHTNISTV